MHVAVQLEFKADRKEPLGTLVRRLAALFESSGLQPHIMASFSDGPPVQRTTSAVERAIRKYPASADALAVHRGLRDSAAADGSPTRRIRSAKGGSSRTLSNDGSIPRNCNWRSRAAKAFQDVR